METEDQENIWPGPPRPLLTRGQGALAVKSTFYLFCFRETDSLRFLVVVSKCGDGHCIDGDDGELLFFGW